MSDTPSGRVAAGAAIAAWVGVGIAGCVVWRVKVQADRMLLETSRLLVEMAQIQAGTSQVQEETDAKLALLDDYRERRYSR